MRTWMMAAAGAAALAVPVAVIAQNNASEMPANESMANATAPAQIVVSRDILHVQVILDKLGFGPGILDGREGMSLTNALKGFQEARGLEITGEIDQDTLVQLYQYRGWRPTKTLQLSPAVFEGPFLNPIPKDPNEQAKLEGLPYRTPLEKLAEMFHTTPEVLIAMNGRDAAFGPNAVLTLPNALPAERNYPDNWNADWQRTAAALNVGSNSPKAAKITISKADGTLKLWDEQNQLIGQFTATLGSSTYPLPIGTWEVKGTAFNPDWGFDPDLIAGTKAGAEAAVVPPGPNNPVGVVWIDLSKEHYGIHGTAEPQQIGRTESNGCIRLTNWDAARVAMMVGPGTPAIFTE